MLRVKVSQHLLRIVTSRNTSLRSTCLCALLESLWWVISLICLASSVSWFYQRIQTPKLWRRTIHGSYAKECHQSSVSSVLSGWQRMWNTIAHSTTFTHQMNTKMQRNRFIKCTWQKEVITWLLELPTQSQTSRRKPPIKWHSKRHF